MVNAPIAMSEQMITLAAAAFCAGLGVYAVSLAFRRTEPGPILTLAYMLFAVSLGVSSWAVW